ncbi:type II toxin-antitoxin system death-on-curing family toxin [Bacteriovorax sp. PP10]|uniref:Type II toxin-antitoxin system death-on-curing family toxin n=1 Tax=Bacteriovorax antarcticus TaxID=3088717 RepID=A0ABU5VTA3_9BACT|nr:type II toxin-antitoxin system death-on-curing family toxin [Bacteriovorax sp. PP10]MEA9356278.1 type II toxin-antitoxin system death-on-curing family toxin [Bacteriovorax sp. PP10]
MKIKVPTVENVIQTNKFVCNEKGQISHLLDRGKIESAISTAFYPGSEPFENGGVARLAGSLCFYLTKIHAFLDGNKRTATLAAIIFMNANGWDLSYPDNDEDEFSELAKIINQAAASEISRGELIEWFELHKILID